MPYKDPEVKKARENARCALNRDKYRAASAAWRRDNKDKEKATAKAYRETHRKERTALVIAWGRRNKAKINAATAARKTRKIQATPAWANPEAIKEVYAEASFLTEVLGEPYHVDHIVPLRSKIVCGLHCEQNLQVIEGVENIRKGNRYWPDMP